MAARSTKRPPASEVVKTLQPQAVVFLYNARTGAIAHSHFFSAVPGESLPDREELERVAYAQAEQDGCNIRAHKALHVDPNMLKRGMGYRIDIKKRAPALVEVKPGRQPPKSL
jgi:hypothetical protein